MSLTTGLISAQFHFRADEFFETVRTSAPNTNDNTSNPVSLTPHKSRWQALFGVPTSPFTHDARPNAIALEVLEGDNLSENEGDSLLPTKDPDQDRVEFLEQPHADNETEAKLDDDDDIDEDDTDDDWHSVDLSLVPAEGEEAQLPLHASAPATPTLVGREPSNGPPPIHRPNESHQPLPDEGGFRRSSRTKAAPRRLIARQSRHHRNGQFVAHC